MKEKKLQSVYRWVYIYSLLMSFFNVKSYIAGMIVGAIGLGIFLGGSTFFSQEVSTETTETKNLDQTQNIPVSDGRQNRTARQAQLLGISEQDLQKELESGKTIETLAEEKGIDMKNIGGRAERESTSEVSKENEKKDITESKVKDIKTEEIPPQSELDNKEKK